MPKVSPTVPLFHSARPDLAEHTEDLLAGFGEQDRAAPLCTDIAAAYRRLIERVEALSVNRSGADKSWVERTLKEWRDHYAAARRVR